MDSRDECYRFEVLRHVQTYKKRFKRAHTDNFNVLLNIYKMNPLKKSKIYNAFSDLILLPNRPDIRSVAMNFDSNESRKERQANTNLHLSQIEKFIHVTNSKKKVMKQPDYDIGNTVPENFTVNMAINDPMGFSVNENKKADESNFNSLLEHLESSEIGDILPVTKMVRVNNTITYDRKSLQKDFKGIGMSDNYTNFLKKMTYQSFIDRKGREINQTYRVDKIEEEILANEGVVVLK